MNGGLTTWVAANMLAVARRVLPEGRRAWADAMDAELSHLPPDAELRWAFGCLLAAIKQGLSSMKTGTFRVNRWIMLVEIIGCFGFLTLAWWEFTFGPSGVVRLNGEIVDKVFLGSPGGGYLLGLMILFAFTGLVGPVGLWLGLRYVLSNRALDNRALGITLIAAPAVQWIAGLIGMIWMPTGDFATGLELLVLCTLLPIAGVLHLMYLAKPASPPSGARLAVG